MPLPCFAYLTRQYLNSMANITAGIAGIVRSLPCLIALFASQATAIIESSSNAASLRLHPTSVPVAMVTGDFTVLAWVCPATLESGQRAVVQVPGVFELRLDGGTAVAATVRRGGPSPLWLTTSVPTALEAGRWTLLGVSYTRTTATLSVFAYPAGQSVASGTSSSAAMAGLASGPVTGQMAIGALPTGLAGVHGAYGMIVIRDHRILAQDFQTLAASRRYWSVFDADTVAAGGLMNGGLGCRWMTGHAMTTFPDIAAWISFANAAAVGKEVTATNIHIFDRAAPILAANFHAVLVIQGTEGFTYRSHADPPYAGWFLRDVVPSTANFDPVPALAPRTRQLITGPRQLLRVMTSGNSRAVGAHDGTGDFPGNYASGFIEMNRAHVAGVLLRSAHLVSGGSPWFGFDAKASMPYQSGPGTILPLEAANPALDFARFWTGSGAAGGPGAGLMILPGGYYALKCKPEPGSLLLATSPLVVQAHLLRFPGAAPVTWRPVKGFYQNDSGQAGSSTILPLDTTVFSRTFGAGDSAPTLSHLVLTGNVASQIAPGHGCFILSGPAARSFSVVTAVTLESQAGPTNVYLSHPLASAPGPGSDLRFGPWEYSAISYIWPALGPGDPAVFRGIELIAGATGGGVVVFAYSAWRPDVNGFVFGTSGWGGNGYTNQMTEAFPGSNAAWMAATQADVWLQTPATQSAPPEAMSQYTALVRGALPQAEIVWAGDLAHGEFVGTVEDDPWNVYIQDHASAEGVVGLVSAPDPMLGPWYEQYADGMRFNAWHLCQRGNQRQAEVWTRMLKRGAIDLCLRADLNFDGQETIADFGAFQTLFVAGDPLADINGDGQLTIQDFGAFQTQFVGGC